MPSDATQGNHVKVTINDLYKEQQETNKLLVKLASELHNMSDLPVRVRNVEIQQAKMEWIDRIAKTALGGAIVSFVATIFNLFKGAA
jgi:(p)ppGpp synthase/HD superfamily hydrolase